jgi:hypothetical protein
MVQTIAEKFGIEKLLAGLYNSLLYNKKNK